MAYTILAAITKIMLGCIAIVVFAVVVVVGADLALNEGDIVSNIGVNWGDIGAKLGLNWDTNPPPPQTVAVAASEPSVVPDEEEPPRKTANEALAIRFPSEATFSVSSMVPGEGDAYDIATLSGLAAVEPPWPAVEAIPDESEPVAAARAVKPSARSPNVLNDAQISSIRQRLKLTPTQAELWPAVEAALRKIVYTKAAMGPRGGGGTYIDTSSTEVRELRTAVLPLFAHLTEEQKNEVRMIAHVMGLETFVSKL